MFDPRLINPIAKLIFYGPRALGEIGDRVSEWNAERKWKQEASQLDERLACACTRYNWAIDTEECQNNLAYLAGEPGDMQQAMRRYVAMLESGQRSAADTRTLMLAGYRLRKANGSMTATDCDLETELSGDDGNGLRIFVIGAVVVIVFILILVAASSR